MTARATYECDSGVKFTQNTVRLVIVILLYTLCTQHVLHRITRTVTIYLLLRSIVQYFHRQIENKNYSQLLITLLAFYLKNHNTVYDFLEKKTPYVERHYFKHADGTVFSHYSYVCYCSLARQNYLISPSICSFKFFRNPDASLQDSQHHSVVIECFFQQQHLNVINVYSFGEFINRLELKYREECRY